MRIAIHQPEHLPWLGYLDKARRADRFVFLDTVAFKKNYFENRNRIRTAQGWAWLTVPVLIKGRFGQAFDAVEINNQARWAEVYFRTVQQNYAKAPFWKEYAPALEEIILQPRERLVDLNLALIRFLFSAFGISTPTLRASELDPRGRKGELLLDICRKTGATVYLSGPSGRDYLDESLFFAAGIGVEYHSFTHPEYRQMHTPFIPGMSSLDLLLNEGPDAVQRLIPLPGEGI
jgi:hypothetical protein